MFGPLSSVGAGALALMKFFRAPPPLPRANRIGRGRRTVLSIARQVCAAQIRNYDIHKMGAKDRARMQRAKGE